MPQLLHLDASIRTSGSVSRELSGTFADHWRAVHPDGGYVYRDLAAHPLPHLDEAAYTAASTPEDEHTDAQRAGWAISTALIGEVEAADTVLLGVPMYNFSIPSTLKAWLDRIITPGTSYDGEARTGRLAGKRVVVAASRGGSYQPGTPRESFEFQERYLTAVLSSVGLHEDLTWVTAEMTLANVVPALAQFRDLAAESLENAHAAVRGLARVA
ncbi:MAG TPA: NAD(P)H-dependent oxidoreductase [Pseudonocardiaceae bacterium]|jgi:FMN-dependent NADH-azoreductase|nr:NAD(P)H-dependent oxidoreductase [Pseudonocardiaceae bacterium]